MWVGAVWRAPWPASVWASILILLFAAACQGRDAATPLSSATVSAVKLIVGEDGLYTVSGDALRSAGFDPAAGALSLSVDGRPVPWEHVGKGEQTALRFYGQANRRPGQSYRNVYWLEAGHDIPALRQSPPPEDGDLSDSGWATIHIEEQNRYLPNAEPGEDRWFWTSLFAPAEFAIRFDAADPLPAEGSLRLRLWAQSSAPVNPDHRVIISLNDTRLGEAAWDGQGSHQVEMPMPSGLLSAGENRINIEAPGDTGAPADSVLVDWAEVTYLRRLVAGDAPLEFGGQARGFHVRLPVGRLEPDDVAVWDITDPSSPTPLAGFEVRSGELRFGSDGVSRRYAVAVGEGLLQAEEILNVGASVLPDWPGGADLLVVTAPQFRESLAPLIEARRQQGLRVAVLDATEVYDAFSHGQPDPAAIKSLVQHARLEWAAPAPRYLLLAGDASYDPSGYLDDATEADILPTQYINTKYTGWTASDVWYALPAEAFEDDGISLKTRSEIAPLEPMLAVGRLPAQTPDQMEAMVAKILAYEKGGLDTKWLLKALLPADNDAPEFLREAEAFAIGLTGYDATVALVEGDGSASRLAILDAFDSGVGVLGYTGHGSVTLWAQEAILTVDDVPELDNAGRLPIVFTVTCLSGFFPHPTTPSLGEALVRHSEGGAAAALVPSGAALLEDQRPLSRALADALALPSGGGSADIRLGDAVVQAQSSIADQSEGVREVLLTFNLLGDPALVLTR